MSRFRQFAPGEYEGTRVSVRTIKERRALLGKRIGYDERGSCMKHYGRVTAVYRTEIEIDGGSIKHYDVFEQVVVLTDQGLPEGMKDRSE